MVKILLRANGIVQLTHECLRQAGRMDFHRNLLKYVFKCQFKTLDPRIVVGEQQNKNGKERR